MIDFDGNSIHRTQFREEQKMQEFHQTGMGKDFYEGTMPALVRQLTDLTDAVQQLVELVREGVDADRERMDKKDNVKQDW